MRLPFSISLEWPCCSFISRVFLLPCQERRAVGENVSEILQISKIDAVLYEIGSSSTYCTDKELPRTCDIAMTRKN